MKYLLLDDEEKCTIRNEGLQLNRLPIKNKQTNINDNEKTKSLSFEPEIS